MQEVLNCQIQFLSNDAPDTHRSAPLCLIPPLGTYSPSSPPRLGGGGGGGGRSTSTPFLLASAYAIARCLGVICLLSGVSPATTTGSRPASTSDSTPSRHPGMTSASSSHPAEPAATSRSAASP